jgi:hypothetical protein
LNKLKSGENSEREKIGCVEKLDEILNKLKDLKKKRKNLSLEKKNKIEKNLDLGKKTRNSRKP